MDAPRTLQQDIDPGWRFSQCFGDKGDIENVTDADIISAVEFDHTGDFLATGDRAGRIVLFERNEAKKNCEYKFFSEFQSHEPEFDYLKSVEIEEKINKIRWLRRQNSCHMLLSTNDKTIKLWKIYDKQVRSVVDCNLKTPIPAGLIETSGGAYFQKAALSSYIGPSLSPSLHPDSPNNNTISASPSPSSSSSASSSASKNPPPSPPPPLSPNSQAILNTLPRSVADLKLPLTTLHDTVTTAFPRRVFSNAHAYHINSISVNSDGETFLSSDDLRINLWNLGITDQCFNILDIKPANMEDLDEVITTTEFHPTSCNLFMYGVSKGPLRLMDMRCSALCDSYAKIFNETDSNVSRNFFTEILASVSDVKFSRDGRYALSRDYLTLKLWDLNMERAPVKTVPVHDHLHSRLCELYESDVIFDKFDVAFSGDGKQMLTGSYNNFLQIHQVFGTPQDAPPLHLQADKAAFRVRKGQTPGANNTLLKATTAVRRPTTELTMPDFQRKVLHASWHPRENTVAVAATNNLFIFSTI